MEYITNSRIKEKLSRIGFAPHGVKTTCADNYSKFIECGGNVFHIHGEGGEEITRKTFAKWLSTIPENQQPFTIFQAAHKNGNDPSEFSRSRFSFDSIKKEILYNQNLTGLNKIDAVYLAEDNTKYSIQSMQTIIDKLIHSDLINYVGLFNWSLDRIKEIRNAAIKMNQNSVSFIVTTEFSILKPNFGIWDGYINIDDDFKYYLEQEDLLLVVWTTDFNQTPFKGIKIELETIEEPRERDRWTSKINNDKSKLINNYCEINNISPRQLNIAYVKNQQFNTIILLHEDMKPDIDRAIDALSVNFDNILV